eukprot:gene2924-1166_t
MHRDFSWITIVQTIAFISLSVMAICGNILVLYCTSRIKRMQTVTGIFLMNLAVTDLGVGLISLPVSLVSAHNHTLLSNKWFCDLNGASMVIFLLSSLLTLTCISVQKHMCVSYNMRSRFDKKVAIRCIIALWFISVGFGLAPVVGWSYYATSKDGYQCGPFAWEISGRTYSASIFIVGLVIPVSVMSYCYVRLYKTTRQHNTRMRVSAVTSSPKVSVRQQSDSRRTSRQETRMINTFIIIGIVFLLCWLPSGILVMLEFAKVEEPLEYEVFALTLAYGNSTLNPIIYAYRHQDFRRGFKNVLKMCIPKFCRREDDEARGVEMQVNAATIKQGTSSTSL